MNMNVNLASEFPPILPDIAEELRNYLVSPERLEIHNYERNQEFWPRDPDSSALFSCGVSPLSTTLKVQRNPTTGEIVNFSEVSIEDAGATAKNSLSFTRAPIGPLEAVRGNASNFPFLPAGFTEPQVLEDVEDKITDNLLKIAPGFGRGLTFEEDGFTLIADSDDDSGIKKVPKTKDVVNLMELLQDEDSFSDIWKSDSKSQELIINKQWEHSVDLPEEEVIPKGLPVLHISSSNPSSKHRIGTEWAILLDTSRPVKNFEQQIPVMAHTFRFELDTFQKLAILHLEQHHHVFVAAHTSAGKTVVAEYAIALSQKHKTRTIYTSPIKALSNQKYRDFKRNFKDVGLITGDFQINQTGSCLIMTTEILRSMLYCGSEVTRDLEFVIFDEVHYINDKERGHVWEQVLIMLPSHVSIILLSATVPNAIEFADWLGRIKQQKVYVVATYRRPVPLQHYLYTGCGGATKDNRFLILDADGIFIKAGYEKAVASMETKKGPAAPKSKSYAAPQDKTMWNGLISHLNKNNLLPVVAFTFSRNKCDTNARNLMNLDLTTTSEKYHIKLFFDKCVRSLKEPDRQIPQIVHMRDILMRGIGVHHSGVLPIIKEIVEMLFQEGYVKLLFATETFAMGVNMPARTVVFDAIEKHDGIEKRFLLPAEYIQMAGRAGRRGLDKTGTVIILCKNSVLPQVTLTNIMLGRPSHLTSQFRITYKMALSLLRVERLSVEGMLSRSFVEADHEKRKIDMKKQLEDIDRQLVEECTQEISEYMQPLVKFFNSAHSYLETRKELIPAIMGSPRVGKEMRPGRVILITHKHHINKLAVILSYCSKANRNEYRALILTDNSLPADDSKSDLWYKMLALAHEQWFSPQGEIGHAIVNINLLDVFEITSKIIKVDTELVISDWEKRQNARFKDDPVGKSCSFAVQELTKLSLNISDNVDNQFTYLDLIKDLKIHDMNLSQDIQYLTVLKDKLLDDLSGTHIPNFEAQFSVVFKRNLLEETQKQLQHQMSHYSMHLYPEYLNRKKLLQHLKYVNENDNVDLKGRVACEVGMNELLITELVFRNILSKFQPSQVAALLSALVFQAKTWVVPELTEELTKGQEEIQAIYDEICQLENQFQITERQEGNLNFGLVDVVYKWATDTPFADLMQLTDVQEGIIVRCIQQLNEVICDVKDAARLIGDPELKNKMEEASTAIKRDIVFAASLYTQKEAEFV